MAFPKGQPNPNAGRKSRADEQELQKVMQSGWPAKDRIAATKAVAARASAGDPEAWAKLMAYAYGKPRQPVDVAGEGGGPLVIKFVYADDTDSSQEAP